MSPPERRVLAAAPSSGEEQEQEESVGVLAHEWDWTREVVSKFRVSFCSEGKRRLAFLYREVG